METLKTTDLFRSASLLCLGANLSEVERIRGEVHFILHGSDITRSDIAYRTGKSQVNPLQLKETLNLLRDLIFEKPTRGQGDRHAKNHRRSY